MTVGFVNKLTQGTVVPWVWFYIDAYMRYRTVAITLRGAPGMFRFGLEPCAETI